MALPVCFGSEQFQAPTTGVWTNVRKDVAADVSLTQGGGSGIDSPNFGKSGLSCIEVDFCDQINIQSTLEQCSRSTKLTRF